ncbi:MAG: ribonuclease J [Candidatus Pacebacteria bacterium]|nr:ribonuclease J [Candidatus Paceibacterota bacterium]
MEEKNIQVQKLPIRRNTHKRVNFSQSSKPKENSGDCVRVIPLGGLGEVGRNMHVIEYQKQAIIIDIGLRFPEYTMHGIDFLIPNIEYFKEHPDVKVLGVLISHGHYDHIGAIPYIIDKLNYPPIYSPGMAKGIILKRQDEFSHLKKLNINLIDKKNLQLINLGPFKIEPFHVTHSIPDSLGFYITTPKGNILFTGDFKIDFHPVVDSPTDLSKIVSLVNKGVDLLMIDSTGVENKGYSVSEKEIYSNLEALFEEIQGRIILSTFASLVGRIQQAI